MQFYGWIGKSNSKNIGKRDKATDTANYIKYFAKQMGAEDAKIEGINSKNLLVHEEKYYYVLSIAYLKQSWAPYPLINELAKKNKSYMLLTIDEANKGEGIIYRVELSENKLSNLKLSLVERSDAGNYYSLPLSKVKEIDCDGTKYQMMRTDDDDYIIKVLKNLMQ